MKMPPTPLYNRPSQTNRRTPRNRTEAVVELVRLEFDGARLERELAQAERRMARARTALDATRTRAAVLTRRLGSPQEDRT